MLVAKHSCLDLKSVLLTPFLNTLLFTNLTPNCCRVIDFWARNTSEKNYLSIYLIQERKFEISSLSGYFSFSGPGVCETAMFSLQILILEQDMKSHLKSAWKTKKNWKSIKNIHGAVCSTDSGGFLTSSKQGLGLIFIFKWEKNNISIHWIFW